ncbi:MAG TPA: hypothetical protein P5180_15320 [Bacteroidales bacterium]|nr:hypothetical protein [Bacteroidales bacterium]HRW86795.1 hypothetical protein [Bacteroidales bacterium]
MLSQNRIIGSNYFNLFVILGIAGLAGLVIGGRLVVTSAIEMAKAMGVSEKIVGLGTMILLLFILTGKKRKLDRWEAALLLIGYIGYTVKLVAG